MTTVKVNGKVFQGSTITIRVDDKAINVAPQSEREDYVAIEVSGDLANLSSNATINISGNVLGKVQAGGDVTCNDVSSGNVEAGGNVNCNDVSGNVQAACSVACNDISGNAEAGGNIKKG